MIQLHPNEYAPYFKSYIDLLEKNEASLIDNMKITKVEAELLFTSIPEEKQQYRYEAGKWTIKEVIQHIIDAERIFGYRALRFARRDPIDLAGFDENDYVVYSNANDRPFQEILDDFSTIRNSSIYLFKSFTEGALLRVGSANGSIASVRALGYMISGHQLHHLNVIRDRYL